MKQERVLLLTALVLALFSFKNSDTSQIVTNNREATNNSFDEQTQSDDKLDSLCVNTFSFVNIRFSNRLDTLLKVLGTPDSIANPHYECGYLSEVSAVVYYYKGITFNVFNNRAELNEIDFSKQSIVINYKYGLLSSKTTIKEIISKFPKSYAKAIKEKNDNKQMNISIRLIAVKGTDSFIDLTFLNGKLVNLSTWEDC